MARKSSPSKQENAHFGSVFPVLGEFCRECAMSEEMTVWHVCSPRPIGGHREACGAWPGFNTTHPATHEQRSAAGVEGAGGSGGHGRASRHGAERSEAA